MADDSIKLEVVTPLEEAVSTMVSEVTAPSVEGEFGVLPGHRPLLAALDFGRVRFESKGKTCEAAVGPGYAEVGPGQVTLLVENWIPAESLALDEVRDELARADLKVKELSGQESTAEYKQALRDARWAGVQLEVVQRHRQI
jgi:F-type H+-transporting ATPase subunit epsilon